MTVEEIARPQPTPASRRHPLGYGEEGESHPVGQSRGVWGEARIRKTCGSTVLREVCLLEQDP